MARKIVAGAIGTILFLIGVDIILYGHLRPLPSRQKYEVWLPANCETHPSEIVRPGTFEIDFPLERFKAAISPTEKVIVVYHDGIDRSNGIIEYWRPSKEGIFYYSRVELPRIKQNLLGWFRWNVSFSVIYKEGSSTEIEKGVFSYTPFGKRQSHIVHGYVLGIILSVFGCVAFWLGWTKLDP